MVAVSIRACASGIVRIIHDTDTKVCGQKLTSSDEQFEHDLQWRPMKAILESL